MALLPCLDGLVMVGNFYSGCVELMLGELNIFSFKIIMGGFYMLI